MIIVFNLIVISIVLLIAYWWANQGVFSALLHLLAVITAGAIALGLWEPIVVGLALRGGNMDNYMWGITLIMLFAIALFALRLGTDKICPANVNMPRWANLTFGGPVGLFAGVLTVGMLIIGCGFLQSSSEMMGWSGYGRSQRGEIVRYSNKKLWIPVHYWTSEFYSWMSVSSMYTMTPMRHYTPDLYRQAALVRDSFKNGKGQLALAPSDVRVDRQVKDEALGVLTIQAQFSGHGLDFGESLTLANSQVRLIGTAYGKSKAPVLHPYKWLQDGRILAFDNPTHYATSKSGQENVALTFGFKVPAGFEARFIQIRNLRLNLPAAVAGELGVWEQKMGAEVVFVPGQPIPDHQLVVSNDIRGITASKNAMPGGLTVSDDGYLVEGDGEFASGRDWGISRALQIKGIYEPPGTRIVRVNVSRGSVCSLFNDALRELVGENAEVALIDATGRHYSPLGYRLNMGPTEGKRIKLAPGSFVRTLDELPYLPTSGTQQLFLYFRVTIGETVVEFRVGEESVGVCNVPIEMR